LSLSDGDETACSMKTVLRGASSNDTECCLIENSLFVSQPPRANVWCARRKKVKRFAAFAWNQLTFTSVRFNCPERFARVATERSVQHSKSSYFVPNWEVTWRINKISCRPCPRDLSRRHIPMLKVSHNFECSSLLKETQWSKSHFLKQLFQQRNKATNTQCRFSLRLNQRFPTFSLLHP